MRARLHSPDLACAHVAALEALESGKLSDSIFNLGSGTGYTVGEVLEVSRKVTGKTVPMDLGPRRDGDPAVLVASAQHIRDVLGWAPRHSSLEEIVDSAWRWMSGHPC
jgi:UDP-glucose 4-epimerase